MLFTLLLRPQFRDAPCRICRTAAIAKLNCIAAQFIYMKVA
jgi:hypothetical protein